jgi:acetylglutamate kinase
MSNVEWSFSRDGMDDPQLRTHAPEPSTQNAHSKTLDSQPVVVKMGGALLADEGALGAFVEGVGRMQAARPVVVVHGGGAQATALAGRLGHTPTVVQGRRVTTDLDLDIAQWALRGKLNTQLVAALQHGGGLRAVGLSGADAGLVRVTRRPPWTLDGETVDFGWVGDVEGVAAGVLTCLADGGFVPVVAPLGIDDAGQVYNVNADTVARAVAVALGAAALVLVTPTGGVRRSADDPASHLATLDADAFAAGVEAGWIAGGMRVKLRAAFDALAGGVEAAYVAAPGDLPALEAATRVVH